MSEKELVARVVQLEHELAELKRSVLSHFNAINALVQTQGHQNYFNQRVMLSLGMDVEGNA